MAWDQLARPGSTLDESPLESARFGLDVARLTVGQGELDRKGLLEAVEASGAQVVVVRYDSRRQDVAALVASGRRAVIQTGALTYWEIALADRLRTSPVEGMRVDTAATLFGAAGADPADVVRTVVRSSFADYGNHYTADPLLDRSAALAGYEDWAVRTLADDPGRVLVMAQAGRPAGAATVEMSANGADVEVLLAGLVPSAQGRGLYPHLLGACADVGASRGATRLVISTQVHNTRVQRSWARQGLRPFAAVETLHLVDRGLLRQSLSVDDRAPTET